MASESGHVAPLGDCRHPDCAAFSFGIEEEYFLVEAVTKQAVFEPPEGVFRDAMRACGGQIKREFLQAQVEAITTPCTAPGTRRTC